MKTSDKILAFGKHGLRPVGKRDKDDVGNPTQLFEAKLLRPGQFKHPTAGWKLSIDDDRRDLFKSTAEKMLDDGVAIPITSKHFTKDAKDTLGQIESVSIDSDGWLTAIAQFTGEDAIKAASRNFVSVEIEDDVADGEGNEYGQAITSVTLTPRPIVKGQKPRIAASHDSKRKVQVYFFDDGDPSMDILELLNEIVGGDTTLTAENLKDELGPRLEAGAKADDLQTQLEAANKKAINLQAKLDASGKKPEIDEDVLEDTAENTQEKLDNLVIAGKITPAVAEKLAASLIGDEGNRNVLALSTRAAKAAGMSKPYAKEIIAALSLNDPVKLGERTKRQTLTLSRDNPDDDQPNDDWVEETIKERNEQIVATG